ncbi:MFS transporter [Robbsia andropogonis]|uniref:MFS transporter n=1 Tax=Robbsia andropogonis TaxID=28092 RepID=UPI003D2176C7
MLAWYRKISYAERRTFWACFGGWALDALDLQMFSLVIPAIITEWAVTKIQAGAISSVTLIASALGGWICGAAADRYGRVRVLQWTVIWFSLFTLFSAFAQNYTQLLIFKALQGFGFGGEWAAGAVLMAGAIRDQHRGKAMGAVQGAWAVGWAAAVLVYTVVFSCMVPHIGWRFMFGLGIAPALLILYIRRSVREPRRQAPAALPICAPSGCRARVQLGVTPLLAIFSPDMLRMTLVGGLLGIGAHGGYAALTTWLPTYLETERHLTVMGTGSYLAVIIVAFFFGCLAASVMLDRIGRRGTILLFAVGCIITVMAYMFPPLSNQATLVLGFPLGFFAAGIPASMGALFSELYPQGSRGAGVGFCYNVGRLVSAGFPVMVGHLSGACSLGFAIGVNAALAYAIVVLAILMLPETRGRHLATDRAAV